METSQRFIPAVHKRYTCASGVSSLVIPNQVGPMFKYGLKSKVVFSTLISFLTVQPID